MNKLCPLTGDSCMEHGCEWYTHITGKNPQTEEIIDKFGCAITFLPMLMIENSQMQRQTGAAVESFRNEVAAGIQRASKQLSNGEHKDPKLVEIDDAL